MFDSLQTSKLISYWLRHNPGDANLHADEFGWVSTEDLLKALNQRGQETAIGDLHTLNLSFDKIRWEFSDDQSGIRATHGHSIPVILPEGAVEPPAVLFHGSSSKSLESIIKTGLQPMSRRFVHCSDTIDMAIEAGKRHGKPIVVEIDAENLFKNGFLFYKTSENVWLTNAVPIYDLSFKPWKSVDKQEKDGFLRQLRQEIAEEHILFNKTANLELVLRRYDCDDCLFFDRSDWKIYLVHLVWQGRQANSNFPMTKVYSSFLTWAENELTTDQKDWYLI